MRMRREVLGPRFALAASLPSAFRDEPFTVEQKDFFAVGQLPHIFSHVAIAPADADILYAYNDPLRRLSHGNDGIIFTPARDPYRPYTCPTLLKWKPANMNSIDFRLQTKWRREGDKPAPQPRCAQRPRPAPPITACALESHLAQMGPCPTYLDRHPATPRPGPRFVLCTATQTALSIYDWITFTPEQFERFAADPQRDERVVECAHTRPPPPVLAIRPSEGAHPRPRLALRPHQVRVRPLVANGRVPPG